MSELNDYLNGKKLIGDDYSTAEILHWFEDEKEGYSNLGAKNRDFYTYDYHALNTIHGYSKISLSQDVKVLAFGAEYGDELIPLLEYLGDVIVLDPSESFHAKDSQIKKIVWQKPEESGHLMFDSNSFDLITCFGVLHHVPNVSFVISEMYRVLAPGAFLLLREPIVSMGDWSRPRPNLTKRERGIPKELLLKICLNAGFKILSKRLCVFTPLGIALKKMGYKKSVFNNHLLTYLDYLLSFMSSFNANNYQRTTFYSKLAPSSLFLVLQKPKDEIQ